MDKDNRHIPYILKLKGKIKNDHEISHSESITDKNDISYLEKQTQYEIVDTKILNSIDDTTSLFKLELAAKIRYKEDFPETSFLKVPFRKKGKEDTGKGQGFATLTANTLISQCNEVINNSITLPQVFGFENIFNIVNKKLEISLPPYMGIYISDDFIFSDVFKIRNANAFEFSNSESPQYFDKLATDSEKLENSNFSVQEKEELLFQADFFYGFKNFTTDVIKIISSEEIPEQAITKFSVASKLKNETYQQELKSYLDEIFFVAVDFFNDPSKDILHIEETNIKLNLFSTFYSSILGEAVLSLIKSVVGHLVPTIVLDDIQLEWENGRSFKVTMKNYSQYRIEFTFFGNKTLFALLGYAQYSGIENMKFPMHLEQKNTLLRSNIKKKDIEKQFIMQPFPYYIVVKNASEAKNLVFDDGKKITILGILHSDSSFISIPIKINSNKKIRITLLDFNRNPLKYDISLIIHLKCTDH